MSFKVPSDFSDFVSNKESLLHEIQINADSQRDFSVLQLYFAEKVDVAVAFERRLAIQQFLDQILLGEKPYLWHHGQTLTVLVAIDYSHNEIYLCTSIEYGDYVDDEWFLVYLAMEITREFPDVFVQLRDNDGEFLLIEAADHLEAWISPETATNRIWIAKLSIHIIPADIVPLSPNGLSTEVGLRTMRDFNESGSLTTLAANINIQKAIRSRTTSIYPARLPALDHCICAIMPSWLANATERYPSLVGHAVAALSSIESEKISKKVQQVSLGDNDNLVARSVRLTKAQYAQMTFKQFKMPRKYHSQMRRVSESNSAKVQKSFDLGFRLLCGIELAVSNAREALGLVEKTKASNSDLVRAYLAQLRMQISEDKSHLIVAVSSISTNKSSQVPDGLGTLHTVASALVPSVVDILSSIPDTSDNDNDVSMADKQLFELVKNGSITWDGDDWLYLSPEDFEKRMNQFQTVQPEESTGVDPSSAVVPLESSLENNKKDSLQSLVDGFKDFLVQESDIDGVTASPSRSSQKKTTSARESQPRTQQKPNRGATTDASSSHVFYDAESFTGEGFGQLLDAKYLETLLQSVENNDDPSDDAAGVAVHHAVASVAEKFIDDAKRGASAVQDVDHDSDDESSRDSDDISAGNEKIQSGSDEEEDGDDDGNMDDEDDGFYDEYEGGFDDGDFELADEQLKEMTGFNAFKRNEEGGEEHEDLFSMEDLERAMDSELMSEDAFMNTFQETFRQRYGDDFDLSKLNEEDLDEHFLANFLNAHAEGLGVNVGPFQQILAQMGLEPPRPPPSNR